MADANPTLPLALPNLSFEEIKTPFEGDLLGRQALAARVTGYLDRLKVGAVLALDAPWGEGKTWFARHWAAQLRQDGYRVGVIDAFQQDYVEDPFLLLAAEIKRLSSADASAMRRLTAKAAKVGSALLPVATKAAINLAGKVIGTNDLAGEFSEAVAKGAEKGADAAQAWVKRKLNDHEKERASVQAFREELAKFAAASDKPVVIFIDELDRCRPAFAVRLIERIKHFFDVPNLVFVLLMNREQLEKAIRGVYGAETDASAYLGKFLHLVLRLPKNASRMVADRPHPAKLFVDVTLSRYGLQGPPAKEFAHAFAACAVVFDLSLRDIERGCALYLLAERRWAGLLAYLIALKLRRPGWFEGLRRGDSLTHQQCEGHLHTELNQRDRMGEPADWPGCYFNALAALHRLALGSHEMSHRDVVSNNQRNLFSPGGTISVGEEFERALKCLDLDIEE
ncbi:hypothetical protein D8I24_0023 (plasmid) [Cupriavidus necator H850]|uniref:KAP family P-loop NTPase fold protein n=1 Tax=Cupriavidus necator TaxID=106590 RepID=UPI00189299BB|nr:P-loop NTPase fold protein [Cupriavidus necator]KAI3611865.1 hypothetical protein D8I24_0023 [Cupriavidus necator H850]